MSPEGTEPATLDWLGTTYRTILSGAATAGAMAIVDSEGPAGSGPPRHVHANEDETFVVLTGTCRFWVEGRTFERGPGGTAFIPRGTEHTFRVTDDAPSRHLVILTPAGFEDFFMEMAQGRHRIPEDMAAIERAAARHGLAFTGPPLGPD